MAISSNGIVPSCRFGLFRQTRNRCFKGSFVAVQESQRAIDVEVPRISRGSSTFAVNLLEDWQRQIVSVTEGPHLRFVPQQNFRKATVAGIGRIEIIFMLRLPVTQQLCGIYIAFGIVKWAPTLAFGLVEGNDITRKLRLAIVIQTAIGRNRLGCSKGERHKKGEHREILIVSLPDVNRTA